MKRKRILMSWIMALAIIVSSFSPAYTVFAQTGESVTLAETHTDEASDENSNYPADEGESAVPSSEALGDGEQTPGDGEQTPGDGEQTPGDGEQTPGDGEQTPGDGEQTPGDGEQTPGDGEQTPDDGEQTPGEGDEDKTPDTNKTDLLKSDNFVIKIKQDGKELKDGDWPDFTQPFEIEVEFKVPVLGDDPEHADNPDESKIIRKNDFAEFVLGDGWNLSDTPPFDGNMSATPTGATGPVKVATASIVDGKLRIDFDGEEGVFDGDYHTVNCTFKATMEYDGDTEPNEDGKITIALLGKTYTFQKPTVKTEYEVEKSGEADLAKGTITWTVDVTATQGDDPASLAGFVFSDDLTDVGEYVEGSFQVDEATPSPDCDYTDNKLTYTFPEGATSPQQITFQTKIGDEYYANSEQTVSNTAQLLDSTDVLAKNTGTVKFTPEWIEKEGEAGGEGSGGVYNPKDRTITWTITANQMGADLKGVVITDVLQDGLTFESASWQTWDANTGEWSASETSIDYNDGQFAIGDINTPILLTIVTKVRDDDNTTGITTYTNKASITWKDGPGPGIGSGEIGVGIGYNAITKTGEQKLDDGKPTIQWTVTVDPRGQSIPGLKVYDLLVYGESIDLTKVTGIPSGVNHKDLTPQYNQKYRENTFSGEGLTIQVHPITQDGEPVADLLEITGFGTGEASFTFDTLVTNPDIFAGNGTKNVKNTASLFSANAKLNHATAEVPYKSDLLKKEMLKRGSDPATVTGANNRTTNAGEGFHYIDHTVIFRLAVNADGLDVSGSKDASGTPGGKAVVTDTLPQGWEFVKFDGDKDFLIYEAEKEGTTLNAKTGPLDPDTDPALVLGKTGDGKQATATFTFANLNRPYIILVKAKPTDDTLKGYLQANNATTTETNRLTLKTDWGKEIKSEQKVSINSQILNKTMESVSSPNVNAGELRWTVEYKPLGIDVDEGTQLTLTDTLSPGLAFRTDKDGNLLLADENITVHEIVLQADGSYQPGAKISLTPSGPVTYRYDSDSAQEQLIFKIPDNKKAYRLVYMTDITGDIGAGVSNQVKLEGEQFQEVDTGKNYVIKDVDVSATMGRNGRLEIFKQDGSEKSLPGAEFKLYRSDKTTAFRTKASGADGKVKMVAIPAPGEYWLKETAAPADYTPEDIWHHVIVEKDGTTSIDGKTGEGSNQLTVKNFQESTAGNLTIEKKLGGNAAETDKEFAFTVTFADAGASGVYDYTKYTAEGVSIGTIQSGGTISLKGGEYVTITGLPKDLEYKVEEKDYSGDGYSVTITGKAQGKIIADQTEKVTFTNTKYHPSQLIIQKTVRGNAGDTRKQFEFTVTFSGKGAADTYSYTGTGGAQSGSIQSGGKILLAHGQTAILDGLPVGLAYTVTEKSYSAEGYSTVSAGASGVISADSTKIAAFINTKNRDRGRDRDRDSDSDSDPTTPFSDLTSELTIQKTVTGRGADRGREFTFIVTFNASGRYHYSGSKTGTIASGQTIALAHGDSVTITGLPLGTTYRVTEREANRDGYYSTSTGASGTITAQGQTAAFYNEKNTGNYNPNTGADLSNPTVTFGLLVFSALLAAACKLGFYRKAIECKTEPDA